MARREKTRTFDLRYNCLVELLLFFRRHCWIAGLWAVRSRVSGEVCGIPDTTGLRGWLDVQNSSSLTSLSVRKSHCQCVTLSPKALPLLLYVSSTSWDRCGTGEGRAGECACLAGEGGGDCKTQVYGRLCVVSIAMFKLYDDASLCTTMHNENWHE